MVAQKSAQGEIPLVLKNEFATVEVARDDSANGSRLLIKDLQTGRQVYLDPLELEALTRAPHSQFARWLDPDLRAGGSEESWPDMGRR